MTIVTLGMDIAKNVFQLHGVDANGSVILHKQLTQKRLLSYLSTLKYTHGMSVFGFFLHETLSSLKINGL